MPSSPLPRRARHALLAAVAVTAALVPATNAAAAPSLEVVADGLANPRGLTVGPGGDVYVAEAGRGGAGPCIAGPEGEACYGPTGAITRVDVHSGANHQVVDGLPSLAAAAGTDALGPQDISFDWHAGYFTVGLGGDPASRAELGPAGPDFAGLYRLDDSGVSKVADLGAYEAANNPDDGNPDAEVDSNPFSVDARGRQILVTDAGGNDLLGVSRSGDVETLAVFEPFRDDDGARRDPRAA